MPFPMTALTYGYPIDGDNSGYQRKDLEAEQS